MVEELWFVSVDVLYVVEGRRRKQARGYTSRRVQLQLSSTMTAEIGEK
jgi:hypothetical protein